MWVSVPPKKILFYLFILTLEDYTGSRVVLNMTINEQTINNLQMMEIR